MKAFCLNTMIVVFLSFLTTGIQAQTTQPKLDHLKLAEALFVGTWQYDVNKDTVEVIECQQYGNVFVENQYSVIKGKKSLRVIYNHVFSSDEDKVYSFVINVSGNYGTWIGKFINEKKWSADIVENFNPANVLGKVEAVFDQQGNMTAIFYDRNDAKTGEYKWLKVK